MSEPVIRLRGVRVHNLRGVDVSIPRNHLTVITGVSGSGKSSLAFDTLYAEGRRRYVECLSTYTRQFLEQVERPDVDGMNHVLPALAIQRTAPASHARSTVGTATEIHDYFRLLFARSGTVHCLRCGQPVTTESVDAVVDRLVGRGGRAVIAFEAAVPAGSWPRERERLEREGFARVVARRGFGTTPIAEATASSDRVEVAVDRLVLEPRRRARIAEAVETAYRHGHGACVVIREDGGRERFSRRFHCAACDLDARPPEPNLFSPNSPLGACPECQGFGRGIEPDLDRIIPDRGLTLAERPVDPWNKPAYRRAYRDLRRAGKEVGLRWDVPYRDLPAGHRRMVERGGHGFYGIDGFFEWLESKKYKVHVRVFLSRYRAYVPCPACAGRRLRPEALAVRVDGRTIASVLEQPVEQTRAWVESLSLPGPFRAVAAPVVDELRKRLRFLAEVGVGYLSLDRPSRTLSGGEHQRIQLARCLGTGLVDTLYVLDEPSVGLHPRDVSRLERILERLRDLGNTVVLVEHDPRMIAAADHLIDLGPGAGEHGGRVLYEGPVVGVRRAEGSLTGDYLAGRRTVAVPRGAAEPGAHGWITLEGASTHNLRDVTARFPRRCLTVVTGVSGSGKSSLVHDTLHGALAGRLQGRSVPAGPYRGLSGVEALGGVELVDQSPIGRTPRSNPVTYVKAFAGIRRKLASTPRARARGLTPGAFSFNVPGGRCDGCEGTGVRKVEMQFLPDLVLPCEACGGTRFRADTLEIRYRGRNVAEILDATADEAGALFEDVPEVVRRLGRLRETGLGYLRLGQPAPTLSGGESQRLKLAAHLGARATGSRVFLLDEPTTGLHLHDLAVLLALLRRLVDEGHTVIVVEHHLDLVRAADWVIDLGPGGGPDGGRVVAEGPPEAVARSGSETGRYLAPRAGSSPRPRG